MNLKQLRCTVCGATIDAKNIDFTKRTATCTACYETFVIEQAENFAKVEVDKTKDIQNYRENLAFAVEKDDAKGMERFAGQILDILPDDFDAAYFYAYAYAKRGDSRYLYDFYDYTDREYTEDSAMRVAEHIANHCDLRDEKKALSFLRSMRYEPDTYVSLFKDTFAERVKKEELYDDITRDVFICHRSTNSDVAKRIVQELEADGNTCWISSRNLRPNDNENYWTNIKKAIKSCRIFLVVSSRDAMFSGDVKKEMAFAKELNKSRIEIKIDESEHNAFFKDFFDGCKWVKGENHEEIKARVADLLAKVLSGQGDVVVRKIEKVKFTPIQEAKPIKKIVVDELHEHDYKKAEVVPPTCKEPGYTVYRCACGEIKKGDFMPKRTEHEFVASERKEPTCTEDGYVKYECRYCDATKKDPLKATGHNFKLSEEKPSTCIEEGYKIYTCQNCGEKKVEKLPLIPHTFGKWVVTKNPTCEEEGTETRQCTYCGHKESRPLAPTGHTFGKWVTKTEPTCTEEGTKIRQCTVCGKAEEETIALTGHSYGEWQLSLTDPEKEERICKKCGAIEIKLRREVEEERRRQKAAEEEEKNKKKNEKMRIIALGSFIVSLASLLCAIILWGVFYKNGYCSHPVAVVLMFCLSFALTVFSLILTKKMEDRGYYDYSIDFPLLIGCTVIIGILLFSNIIHTASSKTIYEKDGVFYAETEGGYEVIKVKEKEELTILSQINGKKVVSIRNDAFQGNTKITSLVIPDSVTSIGYGAFSGCSSLVELTIPFVGNRADVTSTDTYQYPLGYIFGSSSYTGGTSTTQYYYGSSTSYTTNSYYYIPTSLRSVTVTGGNILYGAFYNCTMLTSVTMSDGVKGIGEYAFYACSKLSSVTIPNSATNIGKYAFYYCSSLSTVTIPTGVTNIGEHAFDHCSKLSSVIISDSVRSIGDYVFSHCTELTSVTIPDSLTSIGRYAFYSCSSLKDVYFSGDESKFQEIDIPYSNDCLTSAEWHYNICTATGQEHTALSPVQENMVVASCTQGEQYDNVVYCKDCGKELSRETITTSSPLGHKPADAVQENVVAVTCTVAGTYDNVVYCERCGEEISRETITTSSPLGHKPADTVQENVVAVTCTVAGTYDNVVYCERCGGELSRESFTINAPGHSYTEETIEVTEYEEGCTTKTCSRCQDVIYEYTIPVKAEGLVYTLSENGEYSVTGYTKKDSSEVVIPSKHLGISVTSIGDSAFSECSNLTSITIPDSVTSIGNQVFYECSSLQYNEYDNVYYLGNAIHPYLVIIKAKDTNVTSIDIVDTAKVIYQFAFSGCSTLTSITIPDSVTSIGSYAFNDCTGLMSVYYTGDIASWCGITFVRYDANPLYYAHNLYINNELITEIEIPNTVTEIKAYAFYNWNWATSITIPDSVTSIGISAFSGCDRLQYNEYDNAYYLGNETHPYLVLIKAKDTNITSIDIADMTKFIYQIAFSRCSNLTSIIIPDSVTSIGESAFSGCSGLTSVYYTGDIASWCGITFDGLMLRASNPLSYAHNLYINNELITEIEIPNTVTGIKANAFAGWNGTSITIPNSVTSIGNEAFYNCSGLMSITFTGTKSQWNKIAKGSNWNNDTGSYTIHCSDGDLDKDENVVTLEEPIYMMGIEYALKTDSTYEVTGYTGTNDNCIIPTMYNGKAVTSIRSSAFSSCRNLKSIIIPDSVKSIGSSVFFGCSSLESVTIPFVGNRADVALNDTYQYPFGYIFGTRSYIGGTMTYQSYYGASTSISTGDSYCIPTSLRSVTVTGGNIFYCAFNNCSNLTNITIGDNVTSIGRDAFSSCKSLTSINVSKENEYYCSEDGVLFDKGKTILVHYPADKIGASYAIPDGVMGIEHGAFQACSRLTSVSIADSVTSIGSCAFLGCSNLASIIIPNGVTIIEGDIICACDSLTSIAIPAGVTRIEECAFQGCRRLTSIAFSGTKAQWNAISKESNWNLNTGGYTVHCIDGDIEK